MLQSGLLNPYRENAASICKREQSKTRVIQEKVQNLISEGTDCVPAVPGLQWSAAALQQQLDHPEAGHSAAPSLPAPLAVLLPGRSVPESTTTQVLLSELSMSQVAPLRY